MLGAPDFVGVARDAIQDAIGHDRQGRSTSASTRSRSRWRRSRTSRKSRSRSSCQEAIGIDVDQLNDFIKHPTSWLNVGSVAVTLPVVGTETLHLFESGQHAALDGYHAPPGRPPRGTRHQLANSADDVEFDPNTFAAVKNTITTAKLLLLLAGPAEPRTARHARRRGRSSRADAPVNTYPAGANVMCQPLHGSEPWLQLIDGDHSWRPNGLPVFCDATCRRLRAHADPAIPRSASARDGESQLNAGNGEFPIWESCVLRPAFRTLYTDWENGAEQFPALGDDTSSDAATDPTAPTTTAGATANSYTSGGVTYVGKTNALRVSASDAVFTDSRLHVEYALHKDGTSAVLAPGTNPQALSIPRERRRRRVEGRLPGERRLRDRRRLDRGVRARHHGAGDHRRHHPTRPPVRHCVDDDGLVLADDGAGSGVASVSATLDGTAIPAATSSTRSSSAPGSHTIVVSTIDNVGNDATKTITFEVHATAESLGKNVVRAFELGLITKQGTANSLGAKTDAALRSHQRGQHATEWNQLGAFINELEAQRGKSIDPVTADRFIAFAQDLIARLG